MTLGTVQSWAILIVAAVMIIILIRILVAVHKQSNKVDSIEERMKLMQNIEEHTVEEEKTNG